MRAVGAAERDLVRTAVRDRLAAGLWVRDLPSVPAGDPDVGQGGDPFAGGGEHERIEPVGDVGAPGGEDPAGGGVGVDDVDAVVVKVVAERPGVAGSQGEAGVGFGGVGEPDEFAIFEPGAGEGALATAILDWAEGRDPAFRAAIRYVAFEPNSPGSDSRVEWREGPEGPAEHSVVIMNELFDAFPVRMFDVGGRGPVEVLVRWDGEQFVELPGGVASIDDAPKAGRVEVNSRAYPAMRALCSLVQRGAVLVFDYGYPQEELWASWRTKGTLLCFYKHTAHEDPYIHVGDQDLTTHVNFSDLAAAAEDEGMTVFGPVAQSEFLYALGAGQLVEAARNDLGEYFARRRALEQLTDGAGLGRVRVLAAVRGLDGPMPGFEPTA